jgi:hypothetical protein
LVDAEARRFPIVLTTVTEISLLSPDVVISPPAKRVLPLQSLEIETRVESAVAIPMILLVIAFACSAESRLSAAAVAVKRERGLTLFSLC